MQSSLRLLGLSGTMGSLRICNRYQPTWQLIISLVEAHSDLVDHARRFHRLRRPLLVTTFFPVFHCFSLFSWCRPGGAGFRLLSPFNLLRSHVPVAGRSNRGPSSIAGEHGPGVPLGRPSLSTWPFRTGRRRIPLSTDAIDNRCHAGLALRCRVGRRPQLTANRLQKLQPPSFADGG